MVADYGHGDLAFAEVRQRLALHLPGATVFATPVPAFDTLAAGFCVGQLALTEGPADRVVFHNVAPRGDEDDPRPANEGEPLVMARVGDGVAVIGPNSGWAFSFVALEATSLHEVPIPGTGSQFRSRDFFPELMPRLLSGDPEALGPQLAPERVPPVPHRSVVYVDGYGNLKTTWTEPPAPSGSRVVVTIGSEAAEAVVSDGAFEVGEHQLSFAPGSSGWKLGDGGQRHFYELFLRGGNAAERFGRPATGTEVRVEPAT